MLGSMPTKRGNPLHSTLECVVATTGFRYLRRTVPRHHIIPRYEWKARFGHLKGVNALDNVVWLTVAQHAEVHLFLYELNHNDLDFQAYQACVGILQKRISRPLHNNGRRRPKRSKTTTLKKNRKPGATYKKYQLPHR